MGGGNSSSLVLPRVVLKTQYIDKNLSVIESETHQRSNYETMKPFSAKGFPVPLIHDNCMSEAWYVPLIIDRPMCGETFAQFPVGFTFNIFCVGPEPYRHFNIPFPLLFETSFSTFTRNCGFPIAQLSIGFFFHVPTLIRNLNEKTWEREWEIFRKYFENISKCYHTQINLVLARNKVGLYTLLTLELLKYLDHRGVKHHFNPNQ